MKWFSFSCAIKYIISLISSITPPIYTTVPCLVQVFSLLIYSQKKVYLRRQMLKPKSYTYLW